MTALALMASLILEDGRRWGQVAEPIQLEDARAILEPDDDDDPTLHLLTRSRGRSKTTDAGGMSVAALVDLLPAGAQGYTAAADRDQAALLVGEMAGLVLRSGLGHVLEVETWKVTNRNTGASVVALAADGPSAFGLRPRWVVVDELGQWPSTPKASTFWEALASSFGKVAGCVVVAITTEPSPGTLGHRILASAEGSPAWRVHRVPGPPPWMSDAAVEEQRRLLLPSAFARLIMNEPDVADEDRLVGPEDLAAAVDAGRLSSDPVHGGTYVIAVDLGLRRDRSVVVVGHQEGSEAEPTTVVDRLLRWTPSGETSVDLQEVEAAVLEVARTFRARVVIDPWQGALLSQRLVQQGVTVDQFNFTASSVGHLARGLFLALQQRRLRLPDDPELVDELLNVRLRSNSAGSIRLDHASGGHDDQAVAIALLIHGLGSSWSPPTTVGTYRWAGGLADRGGSSGSAWARGKLHELAAQGHSGAKKWTERQAEIDARPYRGRGR